MLDTIKKFFVKKADLEATDSETHEFDSLSNPNFLTDPGKINKLLFDVENVSPLCTITFEGISEQFSSSILDVNIKNQQIILDELIPENGNGLITQKDELKLSTIYNGIHLTFKLNIISEGSSRGIAYYKAPFPSRIYYPQRRKSPRFQINFLNIPFSGISARTQSSVGGYIYDLSRSGIAINMQNNRARIQRGNSIKDCKISIDDYTVVFDLSVRFVKKIDSNSGKILIGGYFENIPAKKLLKLTHFIATLEREEIRRRKA